MNTPEHIYREVLTLPESQAREVLDFVVRLKSKRQADTDVRRQAALATLAKYRGRFEAVRIQREMSYDRRSLR